MSELSFNRLVNTLNWNDNFSKIDSSNLWKFWVSSLFQPIHVTKDLLHLRKIILKTYTICYPFRLDYLFSACAFIYIYTLCLRTAKALTSLCKCAVSPESSLFALAIRSFSHELSHFLYFMHFPLRKVFSQTSIRLNPSITCS